MPVNYPIAPWLRPADTTGAYAKGFGLGNQAGQAQAQIAMERARLQEANNRTAVEIALKQQQLEKESMVEAQKLEVAKAYHEQQASLKNQELEMKQQALQEKVKDAAAREALLARYRQNIANGADPIKETLALAGQTGTGAEVAQALRSYGLANKETGSREPLRKTFDIDGKKVEAIYNPASGHFLFAPSDKTPQMKPSEAINALGKTLEWTPKQFGGNTNLLQSIQQGAISDLQKSRGGVAPAAQRKINPFPKSPDDAVKGELYDTPQGVLEFNGKKFVTPMKPQAAVEAPSDSELVDTGSDNTDVQDQEEELA